MWRLQASHVSAPRPAAKRAASVPDGTMPKPAVSRARRPGQVFGSIMGGRVGSGLVSSGGRDLREGVWAALHRGYRASSVSTKPTGHVADLAFSPSLRQARLAVGATVGPHEALLYDLVTGKCIVLGAKEGDVTYSPPGQHGATVPVIRFTAAGTRVLTGSYDRTVRVWSASDGALQHVLGVPHTPPPPPPDDQPAAVAAAAAAAAAATAAAAEGEAAQGGGGDVEMADAGGNAEAGGGGAAADVAGAAAAAAEAIDQAAAALAAPLEPGPWAYTGQISGHHNHVISVAAHPTNDDLAASGGKDSRVLIWDLAKGVATRKLKASADPLDLCFGRGSEAENLLIGAIDSRPDVPDSGGHVAFWDLEVGGLVCSVPQARGHVSCLHCASSGGSVLVGSMDGNVRMLDVMDGKEMWSFRTGMSDVNLVSLSCNGIYVQASGDTNETHILDVRRPGVAVHKLMHDPAHFHGRIEYVNGVSAAWCHTGPTTLVTGSDDSLVRLWDVSKGEPEVARLHGHTSPVSCVAVSAEDELIASGGDEGKAVLYSRRTQGKSSYLVGKEQDNVLLRQSRQDEAMGW